MRNENELDQQDADLEQTAEQSTEQLSSDLHEPSQVDREVDSEDEVYFWSEPGLCG